jgi:Protein-tyrosine phosphatase
MAQNDDTDAAFAPFGDLEYVKCMTPEKKELSPRNNQLQQQNIGLRPLPEDGLSDCSNRRAFGSSNQSSQSSFNADDASKQSNQFQRNKKNLLQRRNSNTSLALALNIQHSSSSLNRFSSHNSLNCLNHTNTHADRSARKGMHDLNYSMMCSLSTNGINSKPEKPETGDRTEYHRKFLSSENLHNLLKNSCKFNTSERPPVFDFSKNSLCLEGAESLEDEEDESCNDGASCNRITIKTKPLSPQSTSEDFKIHLANLHFLENATNPLNLEYLSNLSSAFHINNNGNSSKVSNKNSSNMFASLDHYKIGDDKKITQNRKLDNFFNYKLKSTPPFETMNANEQDRKKCLVKLHQEFWEIPTNFQEKPSVFGHSHKNRYKSILPNETTRVIIQPDSTTEPYINANFIKVIFTFHFDTTRGYNYDFAVFVSQGPDYKTNCFIATQGPMPSTIYEFWLMVCQENRNKNVSVYQ